MRVPLHCFIDFLCDTFIDIDLFFSLFVLSFSVLEGNLTYVTCKLLQWREYICHHNLFLYYECRISQISVAILQNGDRLKEINTISSMFSDCSHFYHCLPTYLEQICRMYKPEPFNYHVMSNCQSMPNNASVT